MLANYYYYCNTLTLTKSKYYSTKESSAILSKYSITMRNAAVPLDHSIYNVTLATANIKTRKHRFISLKSTYQRYSIYTKHKYIGLMKSWSLHSLCSLVPYMYILHMRITYHVPNTVIPWTVNCMHVYVCVNQTLYKISCC